MVERVNNNYSNPYIRNNPSRVRNDEEVPKFLLGDDEGVVWDRNPGKEKTTGKQVPKETQVKKTSNNEVVPKRDSYVSTIAKNEISEETKKTTAEATSNPLTGIINAVKNTFSRIFRFIWYGNDVPENAVSSDVTTTDAEETVASVDEADKIDTASIEPPSHMREFDRRLLEARRGVEGIPARSTSLLTTYDRRGNIRQVSPSDEGRILKGDRSIKM